jgi:hypothetical protein
MREINRANPIHICCEIDPLPPKGGSGSIFFIPNNTISKCVMERKTTGSTLSDLALISQYGGHNYVRKYFLIVFITQEALIPLVG